MYIDSSENFLKLSEKAIKIGEIALCSMLYEVSVSPSPGLVSPISRGAHEDMDFFTFLKSTSSIAYYLPLFVQIGIDYDNDILKRIRKIGVKAENNMFKATCGVNTQKGLLFLIGIICASAGVCVKKGVTLNRFNISKECSYICKDIVKNELINVDKSKKLTNGESIFLKYGIQGIRGEVERGIPTVLEYGLPALEDALNQNLHIKDALSHSLINIMTAVEDTTVINRCGISGLERMRNLAKEAVRLGGMKTKDGRDYIKYMEDVFVRENISPGGAADILAVTLFIYELEKEKQYKNN